MWLEDLRRRGIQPLVEVLEEIRVEKAQRYIAEQRERYWIQKFERSGAPLTNIRDTVSDPRKHSDGRSSDSNHYLPLESRVIGVARKPTVRELREKAGLQIRERSLASGVSEASMTRRERKQAVGVVLVNKVLRVINERLGTDYEAHDVDVPLL